MDGFERWLCVKGDSRSDTQYGGMKLKETMRAYLVTTRWGGGQRRRDHAGDRSAPGW